MVFTSCVICREEILFPLSKSMSVLILSFSETDALAGIGRILQKLCSAQPLLKLFASWDGKIDKDVFQMLINIIGSIQQPECVVLALKELQDKHPSKLGNVLNPKERAQLLTFLCDHIEQWKSVLDCKEILRKLPYYVTIYDKDVTLDCSNVYMLPSNVPQQGMEEWVQHQDVIFLKDCPPIRDLLEFLGCEALTTAKVYCSFIFENFELFSTESQFIHMEFVRKYVLGVKSEYTKDEYFPDLMERLKSLHFISNGQELLPASEFYDPHNDVFKTMEDENKFPLAPCDQPDWLDFLRECGLNHIVSQTQFLDYLLSVAQKAQSTTADNKLKEQSDVLVQHMVERYDIWESDAFLNSIKNVKFIAPGTVDENLSKLHPQHTGYGPGYEQSQFISFNGSVLHNKQTLIWTVQSILPPSVSECSHINQLKTMGVIVNPHPQEVVHHTEKLCSSLSMPSESHPSQDYAYHLAATLKEIFSFLRAHMSEIDSNLKQRLSATPCMLIQETGSLVLPSRMAFNVSSEDEICPYLYKIQRDFAEFEDLFSEIGATSKFSIPQYAAVLKQIHDEISVSTPATMHEEQKRAACMAIGGLFNLLQEMDTDPCPDLYFPCNDSKLHKSSDVVFIDRLNLLGRIEENFSEPILIDTKVCKITRFEAANILEKLSQNNRPKFLSEIIHEQISPDCTNAKSTLADNMTEKLRSSVARNCFERLLRYGTNFEKFQISDQQISEILEEIACLQFIGKLEVKTFMVFQNNEIENSSENRKYFYKWENNSCKIYISCGFSGDYTFFNNVAQIINKISKNRLRFTLGIISSILECSLEKAPRILDNEDIPTLEMNDFSFCCLLEHMCLLRNIVSWFKTILYSGQDNWQL